LGATDLRQGFDALYALVERRLELGRLRRRALAHGISKPLLSARELDGLDLNPTRRRPWLRRAV
jgi:hypothetical protein